MNIVLLQELTSYNNLITEIHSSIIELKKALNGETLMTSTFESMLHSLVDNRIPEMWENKAYTSLKPLTSFINDLTERLIFFNQWISDGPPNIFWMAAFFSVESFLTSVLQSYSRQNKIPIDLLEFDFKFCNKEERGDLRREVHFCFLFLKYFLN
jgi:dynein heavy chain, axonemal